MMGQWGTKYVAVLQIKTLKCAHFVCIICNNYTTMHSEKCNKNDTVSGTNHKASHFVIFSNLLSLLLSHIHISYTAPFLINRHQISHPHLESIIMKHCSEGGAKRLPRLVTQFILPVTKTFAVCCTKHSYNRICSYFKLVRTFVSWLPHALV